MGEMDPTGLVKRVITSPDAPSGTGPYSPALVVGDFVLFPDKDPWIPKRLRSEEPALKSRRD